MSDFTISRCPFSLAMTQRSPTILQHKSHHLPPQGIVLHSFWCSCMYMTGSCLQKPMHAIFTLQHMHTHNQLPYGNASVKQRTVRPVIALKKCSHCSMCGDIGEGTSIMCKIVNITIMMTLCETCCVRLCGLGHMYTYRVMY